MVEDTKNIEPIIVESNYELERGKSIPSLVHADTQGNLYFVLRRDYGQQLKILPELSLSIDSNILVPDLAIYPIFEIVLEQDKIKMEVPPAGVVEILSPTQTMSELVAKCHKYLKLGIKSYWLVIPELRTIYVFDETGEYEIFAKKQLLTDQQLNIEISLEEVF